MKDYALLLQTISNQKKWIIILIFIGFLINTFKIELSRIIDLKILNRDTVLSTIEKDVVINNALLGLMNKTASDRAYIFRFHNGVKYYDGTHKSKMSCDYEVTRSGISREAQRLQDIPTALFANWIKGVVSNDMYFYDIQKINDERVKQTLKIQGIKGVAVAPYYRDGKLYALIGVDYVRNLTSEEINIFEDNKEESIERFKSYVQGIGDLII